MRIILQTQNFSSQVNARTSATAPLSYKTCPVHRSLTCCQNHCVDLVQRHADRHPARPLPDDFQTTKSNVITGCRLPEIPVRFPVWGNSSSAKHSNSSFHRPPLRLPECSTGDQHRLTLAGIRDDQITEPKPELQNVDQLHDRSSVIINRETSQSLHSVGNTATSR
jgi:hypothetical protein